MTRWSDEMRERELEAKALDKENRERLAAGVGEARPAEPPTCTCGAKRDAESWQHADLCPSFAPWKSLSMGPCESCGRLREQLDAAREVLEKIRVQAQGGHADDLVAETAENAAAGAALGVVAAGAYDDQETHLRVYRENEVPTED